MKSIQAAGLYCVILGCSLTGCSRDPNADNPTITPELQEKIIAEDKAVEDEEGGKGAVRN
jgi:hypothetical protein